MRKFNFSSWLRTDYTSFYWHAGLCALIKSNNIIKIILSDQYISFYLVFQLVDVFTIHLRSYIECLRNAYAIWKSIPLYRSCSTFSWISLSNSESGNGLLFLSSKMAFALCNQFNNSSKRSIFSRFSCSTLKILSSIWSNHALFSFHPKKLGEDWVGFGINWKLVKVDGLWFKNFDPAHFEIG